MDLIMRGNTRNRKEPREKLENRVGHKRDPKGTPGDMPGKIVGADGKGVLGQEKRRGKAVYLAPLKETVARGAIIR